MNLPQAHGNKHDIFLPTATAEREEGNIDGLSGGGVGQKR